MTEACKWTEDDDGSWDTGCDSGYFMDDGSPTSRGMKFCCFCGKPIEQVDYVRLDDLI